MIEAGFEAAFANLLTPPILFFALGALAGAFKSDLEVPEQAAKTLALYLMLAIGFKGGAEAGQAGFNRDLAAAGGLGLAFSFVTPFMAFFVLKRFCRLERVNAAAVAAHYGSVSLVTFAAGSEFLRTNGVAFSGHMAAVLALMETPAIIAALLLAGRSADKSRARSHDSIWREVFLNGAAVLLVGAFIVGLLTGERGGAQLSGFVSGALFQGALCLFLLDMGLIAARRFAQSSKLTPESILFAMLWPLAAGALGALAARSAGLSLGDATLFAVLSASASYIAVPAALRVALPKADQGVSLPMALAITFPFNLLIGIPLYHQFARGLIG
jgi:hypothetical protein